MESQTFPELSSLQSPSLSTNVDFQALRKQLQIHLEESGLPLAARTQHKHKSQAWQKVIYASLAGFLREIVLTQDKELQLELLAKAKQWYWEKVARKPPANSQVSTVNESVQPCCTFHRSHKATLDQLTMRKMDAVKSIESRSPPRSQGSPARPRPVSLLDNSQELPSSLSPVIKRLHDSRKAERRALAMYQRQMEKWTVGESIPEAVEHSRRASISSVREEETRPLRVDLTMSEARGASLTERVPPVEWSSQLRKTFYTTRGKNQLRKKDLATEWDAKIAEVENVKRKFAFTGLQCTYRTLTAALVEPKALYSPQLTPASFPRGDERLLTNPFFDPGHRRKKA